MVEGSSALMMGRFTEDQIQAAQRAVFDTAIDIMYVFDIDTLQILDMNEHGLRELGYTIEEVRRLNLYDLHAIEERNRVWQIIDQYKRNGGIHNIRDIHIRRKDGSLIPVEKNGRSMIINGKEIGH